MVTGLDKEIQYKQTLCEQNVLPLSEIGPKRKVESAVTVYMSVNITSVRCQNGNSFETMGMCKRRGIYEKKK